MNIPKQVAPIGRTLTSQTPGDRSQPAVRQSGLGERREPGVVPSGHVVDSFMYAIRGPSGNNEGPILLTSGG